MLDNPEALIRLFDEAQSRYRVLAGHAGIAETLLSAVVSSDCV
jgi:hypothetical protein